MVKVSKKNKMILSRISRLKKYFIDHQIDGYVIPKNNEFFSEFDQFNRLQKISNFSGSAGLAIITKKNNYLFVDGRYTIQAKNQSGKYFKIFDITSNPPSKILKDIKLGLDPKIFTKKLIERLFSKKIKYKLIEDNLIDKILKNKIKKNKGFFTLPSSATGENKNSKINRVIKFLKKLKADYLFVTAPENIAWLLNIRGYDNPNSPIPNCHLIISKDKKILFFSDKYKIKQILKNNRIRKNQFGELNEINSSLNKLPKGTFIIDSTSCSIFFENLIRKKFKILKKSDPIYAFKAIKNNSEINHMINAHFEDGLALTRFIYWIKNNKKKINEIDAEKKLESFRKKSRNYLYPSFNTIAGSGKNGAIVHYRANPKECRWLNKKELFLFDSGGQYKFGTTDVTRTICFQRPNSKIKDIFTRVLKGHIAVYQSNLKKYDNGKKIDVRARKYLKDIGLDYAHGTGHGVGFFLNVHEGPQSISKFNKVKLKEGMIISNEPGYYKENKFGIRIENLIYIKKYKRNLKFKNLTFAPIDTDLINFNLLDKNEKNYLFKYHLDIYSKYSKYLNNREKNWLAKLI
jgi:Xaa-Pro aminopeptidase